jgi:hypothetical protein
LNVDCSVQNAACNYAGMCEPIQPETFTGEPQLDGPPAHLLPDLLGAGAVDMAARDLAARDLADVTLPDMAAPPQDDMSVASIEDMSMPSLDDLRQPDLRQPDLRQPDLRQPDLRQPDLASSDLAVDEDMSVGTLDDMATPTWTSVAPSLSPAIALRAVWGTSGGAPDTDNVIVVGDNGTILRSANSGISWTVETTPGPDLYAVWGDPTAGTIFAAGNGGTLLQRQLSGTWVQSTSLWDGPSPPPIDLRGVWGDAPNGMMTVGNGATLGSWDGIDWSQLCGTNANTDSFHGVSGQDKPSMLVVGNNGTGQGIVNRYSATMCAQIGDMICSPGCPLTNIFSGGPDLFGVSNHLTGGYAVGRSGTILSCSAGSCFADTNSDPNDLFGAWSQPDGSEHFAVGSGGTVLRKSLASGWVSEESGVGSQLNGVWGGSGGSGQVYAVGAAGTIIRRN